MPVGVCSQEPAVVTSEIHPQRGDVIPQTNKVYSFTTRVDQKEDLASHTPGSAAGDARSGTRIHR